ncbi:MAG: dipeptidase PepV [Clostridiales bacterium]|nr:dipeptidase PepV [Clostridiales bacterium]MBE5807603.1 dipeptidase PepV [Clostridiales bacterium]
MNFSKIDARVSAMKDEMIETLRRWISVPSVLAEASGPNAPFGQKTREMLDMALADAKRYGFAVRDIDGYAGDVSMGEGAQTMGILAHLDVVPAGDGWTHDPWGGEIEDNRIYGRGTTDDKGPALCALYAMRAVKDAGVPLKDGVRLILGCDEETGMSDMEHYASKQAMPDYGFSPDADFPIINIEKGGLGLLLSACTHEDGRLCALYAGERPNVVPGIATATVRVDDAEAFSADVAAVAQRKGFKLSVAQNDDGTCTLTAEGVSAHASLPHLGVNAAGMLLIALRELGMGGAPVAALADRLGLEYDGASLGIKQEDELSGPLTCNLGILRYDGDMLTAQLDIRYPLCADEAAMCGAAAMALSGTPIALSRLNGHTPLHVPAEHKVVKGLLKVYSDVTGLDAYTIAIGGGTYSRMMPNTVAFGPNFPGQVDRCHMPEEYFDIDTMLLATKVYAHAIAELAGEGNS